MSKKIRRTTLGLRDALFDEIDALRSGKTNPQKASALSKLTAQVVNTAKLEIEHQKHVFSLPHGKNPDTNISPCANMRLGTDESRTQRQIQSHKSRDSEVVEGEELLSARDPQ